MAAAQTLSITQMYALARSAGLNPARAAVAAAIGMAESSGRTKVTSDNPDGGVNVGVWQLDTKGAGSGYTVSQLQDPGTNAKAMAKASGNGSNWSEWATYASGAYRGFLTEAQTAQSSESSGGSSWITDALKDIAGIPGDALSTVTGAVGSLLSLPSQVTDFFTALERPVQGLMWFVDPGNWARIIAGVFAFLFLGAGLIALGMAA